MFSSRGMDRRCSTQIEFALLVFSYLCCISVCCVALSLLCCISVRCDVFEFVGAVMHWTCFMLKTLIHLGYRHDMPYMPWWLRASWPMRKWWLMTTCSKAWLSATVPTHAFVRQRHSLTALTPSRSLVLRSYGAFCRHALQHQCSLKQRVIKCWQLFCHIGAVSISLLSTKSGGTSWRAPSTMLWAIRNHHRSDRCYTIFITQKNKMRANELLAISSLSHNIQSAHDVSITNIFLHFSKSHFNIVRLPTYLTMVSKNKGV